MLIKKLSMFIKKYCVGNITSLLIKKCYAKGTISLLIKKCYAKGTISLLIKKWKHNVLAPAALEQKNSLFLF